VTGLDVFQIVFLGLGTGFGSALGTELARFIVTTIKEKKEKDRE
jgi:hypothetical protein